MLLPLRIVRTASRWGAIGAVVLGLGAWQTVAAQSPTEANPQLDDLISELIQPSLADGIITDAEQAAIMRQAEHTLKPAEQQQLTTRLNNIKRQLGQPLTTPAKTQSAATPRVSLRLPQRMESKPLEVETRSVTIIQQGQPLVALPPDDSKPPNRVEFVVKKEFVPPTEPPPPPGILAKPPAKRTEIEIVPPAPEPPDLSSIRLAQHQVEPGQVEPGKAESIKAPPATPKSAAPIATSKDAGPRYPELLPGGTIIPQAEGEQIYAMPACESCWRQHIPTGMLDNLSFTTGIEGFKGPVDFGLNGHFGWYNSVNWSVPVYEELGIGVQAGAAATFSSFLVPSFKANTGVEDRQQYFITAGVFQRSPYNVNWGIVYDCLFDAYYHNLRVDQWRYQVGYCLTPQDEVGIWGTFGGHSDGGFVAYPFFTGSFTWDPITQVNVFWERTWENQARTRAWIGWADTDSQLAFGASFHVPLNDWMALIGIGNFFVQPDQGSTNALVGLTFTPPSKGMNGGRFAPLLPVANNEVFVVDLK